MAQIIISNAGDNERFISGNYVGEEVEIAVVEHSAVSEPKVHSYCIYYKKVGKIEEASYKRSWYYVMPKLEKTLFSKFIYQNNDLGALGSLNEDGIQQYWATSGFVLEKSLETKSLLHPKCYTWRGNRKIIIDKVFKPLEMIYVWHTSELTNQYGCGRTNCSFIYLSDDMTEAIFVEDRQKLLYCENIK